MHKILHKKFFERDTVVVARELVGKFLVKRTENTEVDAKIIETEAYDGPEDRAAHGSRGMTPRNKVMFGKAGRFYIYFIYGMYWMLNVVCGPENFPAAILIRGIEVDGLRINGPGRLTKFLNIDKHFNGLEASARSGMWFEDRGLVVGQEQLANTKRIGVDYAGEWAHKPYRFYLKA
jgi:DNA-3-methyladenine glycosylase